MRLRLIALLLLALASAVAGSQVQFTSDTAELLPRDAALRATLTAAERFAGARTVLVELDGSGVDRATLKARTEALADTLRALPVVAEARSGFDLADGAAIRARVAPYATAFVDAELLAERTSEAGIHAALARQQARLASPAGLFLVRAVHEDPLDLIAQATAALAAQGMPGVRLEDGLLLDPTGTRALILVSSAIPPSEVGPEDPRVQAFQQALDGAGLPVSWFGGLRVAWETATGVARDVHQASLLGAALLVAVLLFGFRSWRPVAGAILPSAVAAGCTAIGAWWAGPIHGLQLGFAASLAGLAVDFWVHYHLAAAAQPDQGDWRARYRAGARTARELLPALLLSGGATVVAFGMIATSPLPLVRVLGITGAAAVAGAVLGTVLAGPLVWAAIGRPADVPAPPRAPGFVAAPLLAAVGLLGLLGLGARFDPDPMNLLSTSQASQDDERALGARYGFAEQQGLILLEGDSPGAALDRAARVEAALTATGVVQPVGPARLLPGPATVAARRAALPPVELLQARLDAAADALGMTRFEGAAARLVQAAQPPPPDLWEGTPLAARVTLAGSTALVAVPLRDPTAAPGLRDTLSEVDAEARLVLPRELAAEGMAEARDALLGRAGLAAVAVFALVAAQRRDLLQAVRVVLPAVAAVLAALGTMALAGLPWNPVSLATMIPVVGLTIDYGVFITEGTRTAARAVWLSAITTLAGVAVLVLADSPALRGVGIGMSAGLGAASAVALFALPALLQPQHRVGTWTRRSITALAFAGVVGLHADLLLHAVGAFARPAPVRPPAHTLQVEGPTRRYGPHTLTRAEGIWWLHTEGDPYEAGYAAGVLTAPLRPRMEREMFERFEALVPNPLARWLITRGSVLAGMGLERHLLPAHRIEIQASADAVPEDYWFAGPIYTRKVFYHAIHDLGQALVDTPLLGCTGFAAGGEATANGHWIVGRNFDFEGGVAFDRDKVVRVHRPDRGLAHATVGFTGMIGAVSGVNEAGLAVVINAGASAERPRPGTPMTLIVRELLETARTLEQAEALLRARSGFVSENVLVVEGEAGRAALFEVSPSRVERLDAPGSIAVSNHFRAPAFAADPTNVARQAGATTVPRLRRAEELLQRAHGRLDLAGAAALLADTQGEGDRPLARGHRHALDADLATHGVIIDATARTLWVSRWPNLAGGFVELSLDEALAGRLAPRAVIPADPDAHRALDTRRGRELLRAARRAEAADALELTGRALALLPEHPEALQAHGEALWRAGRTAEARPLLQRALDGPPEYTHQADALRALLESP